MNWIRFQYRVEIKWKLPVEIFQWRLSWDTLSQHRLTDKLPRNKPRISSIRVKMSHHRGSGHLPGGHHHPLPRSQSEYHHSSASSLTPASSSASSSARSSRVWENQQVLALLVSPSFYRSPQDIIFFPLAEAAVLLECELQNSCRYIEFCF